MPSAHYLDLIWLSLVIPTFAVSLRFVRFFIFLCTENVVRWLSPGLHMPYVGGNARLCILISDYSYNHLYTAGWLDCPAYGNEIGFIIPSKVPLGESFNEYITSNKRYSPKQVIHQQRHAGREVSVTLMTFTTHKKLSFGTSIFYLPCVGCMMIFMVICFYTATFTHIILRGVMLASQSIRYIYMYDGWCLFTKLIRYICVNIYTFAFLTVYCLASL